MKATQNRIDLSKENKKQLLNEWKKAYAKGLIEALAPSGDFLQIGFSRDTADYFQNFKVNSHTIIASTPEAIQEGIEWASKDPSRKIIQGSWIKELPKLGKFNTILFNEYTELDESQTLNYILSDEIIAGVAQTKELLQELGKEMAQVSAKYSNEELESFYQKIGQHKKDKVNHFFRNLMVNGNITKEQYNDFIRKHNLEFVEPIQEGLILDKPAAMIQCLQECLNSHMEVGSRFAAFSNDIVSKYDDAHFFDQIITNYEVDFKEKLIPLNLQGKNFEALVLLVEKKKGEGSKK